MQCYDDISSQEYFPETAYEILSSDTLDVMDQTKLSIARNEIYARHGRKFNDEFIKAVFMSKKWYKPLYDAVEFEAIESKVLNPFEKENIKLLIEIEQVNNFRKEAGMNYERPWKG